MIDDAMGSRGESRGDWGVMGRMSPRAEAHVEQPTIVVAHYVGSELLIPDVGVKVRSSA